MRDILAQFLPSLARGVYRLDQQLCEDSRDDPRAYLWEKATLLPGEYRQFILDRLKADQKNPFEILNNYQIPVPSARTRSVQKKFREYFQEHDHFSNWLQCKDSDIYLVHTEKWALRSP